MVSEASPATQALSTKLWTVIVANALDGNMKVWNDAAMTDASTVLENVDLNSIKVPTYLLYGSADEACPPEANKALLSGFSAKREINYEGFTHDDFYKSVKNITSDVIVILGSGATTMIAAASTLTLISLI